MKFVSEYTKYNIENGRKNLTTWLFVKNVFLSIWHAFIVFILSLLGMQAYGNLSSKGIIIGLSDFETFLMLVLSFIAICKVFTYNGSLNKITLLVSLACLVQAILIMWLVSKFKQMRTFGTFEQIIQNPYLIFLAVGIGFATTYIEFMINFI